MQPKLYFHRSNLTNSPLSILNIMKLPVCWIFSTPIVLAATLIALVCGCEPEADVVKSVDSTAIPPAVVSPADPTISGQQLTTDEASSEKPLDASQTSLFPESKKKSPQPAMTGANGASKDGVDEPEQDFEDATNEDAATETVEAVSASTENKFAVSFFCWNIESEGSDPEVIAKELMEMGAYDVYALTEFLPSAKELFEKTLGEDFELIMSRSGYNDRLAIAFDTRLYELIKSFEIEKINFKNRYRSPLVAHLKDKRTGTEFYVMNNHLARGKEEVRLIQVKQLVTWARTQLLPIVALGDYNLDYVFATEKGNSAFEPMLHDNVWRWVKPVEMIDTNWYDNPKDPDGEDDYPGSLLDFAFVSGPAKAWKATCKVIVRPGDFPDDETTSDHRPFELLISN